MSEKFKDFVKAHPIFSYLLASTITGKICKMVVDIVRSITGKYPPATPIYWKPVDTDGTQDDCDGPVVETEESEETTDTE